MKDKFIDLQTRKLMTGSIDRRKFMMSVLATGLTVPAALSLANRAEASTQKAAACSEWGSRMAQPRTRWIQEPLKITSRL